MEGDVLTMEGKTIIRKRLRAGRRMTLRALVTGGYTTAASKVSPFFTFFFLGGWVFVFLCLFLGVFVLVWWVLSFLNLGPMFWVGMPCLPRVFWIFCCFGLAGFFFCRGECFFVLCGVSFFCFSFIFFFGCVDFFLVIGFVFGLVVWFLFFVLSGCVFFFLSRLDVRFAD